MGGYNVIFLGIINFFGDREDGRLVLMPDGRNPPNGIDRHHASIYVTRSGVADDSQWPRTQNQDLAHENRDRDVQVHRIDEPSTLSISGIDSGDEAFEGSEFARIIRLKDIDSKIDIQPRTAKTIAQLPIGHGRLKSRRIKDTGLVAEFEVGHDGPITITAGHRVLKLHPGTEFVIGNISDNFGPHSTNPEASHFRLYGLLDSKGASPNLNAPKPNQITAMGVPELTSGHPFIRHIRAFTDVPHIECIVTGCC